jgi:hypothetical protein
MKHVIERFLGMRTEHVLDRFAALPNAYDGRDFVYVPGTRKDRVLLVAHADTVSNTPVTSLQWRGNILQLPFPSKARCLGADDRAGIALMWLLRRSGHSVLITDGEETGGLGAQAAIKDLGSELGKHHFAVQVDRRFDREMVFYDCATPEFVAFMRQATRFRVEEGSFSDISFICPDAEICGVNLAAGYWNEHTQFETFSYDAWLRTFNTVRALVARPELPRFELPYVAVEETFDADWWSGKSWKKAATTARKPSYKEVLNAALLEFMQDFADDSVCGARQEAWLYHDDDLLNTVLAFLWTYHQELCEGLSEETHNNLTNAEAILLLRHNETQGIDCIFFDTHARAQIFFQAIKAQAESAYHPPSSLSGSRESIVSPV